MPKRVSGIVAALIACVLPCRAGDAWHCTSAASRVVFRVPRDAGDNVVVRIPAEAGFPSDGAIGVFDARGTAVQGWGVRAGGAPAALVHCPDSREDDRFFVYPVVGADPGTGTWTEDRTPVSMRVREARIKSAPNTWEKMAYVYARRSGGRDVVTNLTDFGLVDIAGLMREGESPTREAHDLSPGRFRWHRRQVAGSGAHWLVRLRTAVHCPARGVYRFALGSASASYLLLDGSLAVANPDGSEYGDWVAGVPVVLDAGLHWLDVYAYTDDELGLEIGWGRPANETLERVPRSALAAAVEVPDARVESARRRVQPDFAFDVPPVQSYRLAGSDAVFIPVKFRERSEGTAGASLKYEWDFGDGTRGTGRFPLHTYGAPGDYRATLTITGEGETWSCTRAVDVRQTVPRVHAVEFRPGAVPLAAYPADPVHPVLVCAGTGPREASFTIEVDVRLATGGGTNWTREVALTNQEEHITMASDRAGDIERVTWRVRHVGRQVGGGCIRFVRAPFARLPVRAVNDMLYDDEGNVLVLVPGDTAGVYAQPALATERVFGRLSCLDDSLFPLGAMTKEGPPYYRILAWLLDGPDRPVVSYERLPLWQDLEGVHGPAATIARAVTACASADVAVVSIGLQDLLAGSDPGRYERCMAAVVDVLSATRGIPVVLVTLPPYPSDAARVRPLAAAVRRVADARSVPVADLFSAFMGAGGGPGDFFDLREVALSPRGDKLAARVIAWAMLTGEGER